MLGQSEERKKYYLSISGGKLVHSENGEKKYYTFVEGKLEKIYRQERNFNGETVLYWYIDIRGEGTELYSIALPYASGVFKSIVLSLASEPTVGLGKIRIEPYEKNGYTKVVVKAGERRLDWVTKELPPIEEVEIGGRKIKDDSKRMLLISSLVKDINKTLGKQIEL